MPPKKMISTALIEQDHSSMQHQLPYPLYGAIATKNELPFHIRNQNEAYDYFYLDLQATNIQSTLSIPTQLTFNNNRDVPYLGAPASNYELSIVRFQLDTSTLPSFIPIIQPNQPDVNKTIYSFTLSYEFGPTDYIQQTFVEWSPQNLAAAPPSLPYPYQDLSTGYYGCANIQWFAILLQNTLNTCFSDLNTQVVAGGGTLPTTYPPVIVFDVVSDVFTIYSDQAGYDPNLMVSPIKIFFNAPMYGLLESFVFTYLGTQSSLGRTYQLVVNSLNATNTTFLPTGTSDTTAVISTQTSSTINIWNPVESIVFTSNSLPISQTSILPPIILYEGQNIGQNPSNSNVQNIITSFQSPNQIYKPYISYEPSVYRFISLNGNEPLKMFSIQCYWRDFQGSFNPFLLGSAQSFSMLCMFKRRNSY